MNIFFIGSIRGGRSHQPEYQQIVNELKAYGHVSSEHIAADMITDYGETMLTKESIHDREMERLRECAVVIADVSRPSLGVGYLIAQAVLLEKPVIALYQGDHTYRLSAMIKGNRSVRVFTYRTLDDIIDIFSETLPTLV